MEMDERAIEVSFPLDSEGFLRRECPTCEREFKWLVSAEGEGQPVPIGGYYCPYCRVQAPPGSWFTKAQLELARNVVTTKVVGPELDRFSRDLRRASQASGGLLKFDVKMDLPPSLDPLLESDDMQRMDFVCHPTEPVKVLETWDRDVHCLICGQRSIN